MKIKDINAALKRIDVPPMGAKQADYYRAGVRALAFELEKDATPASDIKRHAMAFAEYLESTGDMPAMFDDYMAQSTVDRTLEKNLRHVAAVRTGPEILRASYMQLPGHIEELPDAKAEALDDLRGVLEKHNMSIVLGAMHGDIHIKYHRFAIKTVHDGQLIAEDLT